MAPTVNKESIWSFFYGKWEVHVLALSG